MSRVYINIYSLVPSSFDGCKPQLQVYAFPRFRTSNTELASGIFFFFTMELLQAVQYYFIADSLDSPICNEIINKTLTLLGFLHICMQPYMLQVINCALTQNPKYRDRYVVIKRFEYCELIFEGHPSNAHKSELAYVITRTVKTSTHTIPDSA